MIKQLSPLAPFAAPESSFMASISSLRSSAVEPLALEAKRLVARLSPPSAACLYHLMASWAFASIPTPVCSLALSYFRHMSKHTSVKYPTAY